MYISVPAILLCITSNTRKLCYRKDDRAMRPIYRLFYPNFVHAYIHYFARIWFWTNLSRSDSSHWLDFRFERSSVAGINTQKLHVLKTRVQSFGLTVLRSVAR